MNWNSLFKNDSKPINIYESELFDEWLKTLPINEHSRTVYGTYRDRLCEWIRENNLTTLDTKAAENFLIYQVNKSGARQGQTRWSVFSRYNDWLIKRGNLTVNPWDKCDLALCGCDKEAVAKDYARQRAARVKKEQALSEVEETPKFTLSDIAILLVAIEDQDEDTIKRVLGQ